MSVTKKYIVTKSLQTFVVPAGCFSVTANLIGGKGGGPPGSSYGRPGRVAATFPVTPGDILYITVGESGEMSSDPTHSKFSNNTYGGGAGGHSTLSGGYPGGAGGGASDIRIGGTDLAHRVLIAAGGGGISGGGQAGGHGGPDTGGDGSGTPSTTKGHGATQTAGGACGTTGSGGVGADPPTNGTLGMGGFGGGNGGTQPRGGGGGGGGLYGGGGGAGNSAAGTAGGGGGGSNHVEATINGAAPTGVANEGGYDGSDYSTVYITYNVPPVTILESPANGDYVDASINTLPFVFQYSDPGDVPTPTAHQIIIEQNSDGSLLYDSGKVSSSAVSVNIDVSSFPTNELIRWKARTWDANDVVGAYAPYTTFVRSAVPTVSMTPANGDTLATGQPTIDWSGTDYHGRSQQSWSVIIRQISNNVIVYHQSGVDPTTRSIRPVIPVLSTGQLYTITVTVTDSGFLSASEAVNVSTSFAAPDPFYFTVDASQINDIGYVLIDWTSATADPEIVSWRVYQKENDETAWTLLAEIFNVNTRQYHDWMVQSGHTYNFSVTQVANRFGELIESPVGYDDTGPVLTPYDIAFSNYWIIDETDDTASVKMTNVTSAPATEEYQEQVFTLIGRGQKKDYGTRLGYVGTLTIQLRGMEGEPGVIKDKLIQLKANQNEYWFRTPFGELYKIALGNVGYTPIPGVGTNEMYDVSIPYNEVA